jgi:hypothetical protein
MFRRVTLLSFLIVSSVFILWTMSLGWVRPKDLSTYRLYLKQQQEIASSGKALPTSAYQTRENVRKDIWYLENGPTRLHYRIESESSLLTLVPTDHKIDIIENLQKIRCWMQDKVYANTTDQATMQQVRFFEADTGSYQYTTQQFLAQSVALSLFRIPGSELPLLCDPKTAFLKGIAKDVSFSVSGKTPQFQAQQFKASLNKADL